MSPISRDAAIKQFLTDAGLDVNVRPVAKTLLRVATEIAQKTGKGVDVSLLSLVQSIIGVEH